MNRSRLTISQPNDIAFHWAEGGCVDGDTQYVSSGTGWQRAAVPDDHNYVTVSRLEPVTGTLRVQRWLPDIDNMAKDRALGGGAIKGCGGDSALLAKNRPLSDDRSALLPAHPHDPGTTPRR